MMKNVSLVNVCTAKRASHLLNFNVTEVMFFITRYNLKIVISFFIFTFYIINQVSIFNFQIA